MNQSSPQTISFSAVEGGSRIDKVVAEYLGVSRSQLQQMDPSFMVGKIVVKPSYTVKPEDTLSCQYHELPQPNIEPAYVPLNILYEDENVLVINKEQGVVVHPAPGHFQDTLIQGVLYYCNGMEERFTDENVRPGVVHRLDKDTSGVIIMAKNPEAQSFLADQFKARTTEKTYIAIVHGAPKKKRDVIETLHTRHRWDRQRFTVSTHQGKEAVTGYRVAQSYENYSLVYFFPKTGRTHQIRVHAKHIGCPIVGDPIYGKPKDTSSLMLHALELKITIPGHSEPSTFFAPEPDRFSNYLKVLS